MSASEQKPEFMLFFRGGHWDRGLSPEELQQVMDRVMIWFESLQQRGKIKAGQPLAPVGRMVSGEKRTVADGPFAESKEVVGGYLLLQVESLDAAVVIAKTCPTLDYGITIEVRPVLEECPIFKRLREQPVEATA
jgi:hypothetical protein